MPASTTAHRPAARAPDVDRRRGPLAGRVQNQPVGPAAQHAVGHQLGEHGGRAGRRRRARSVGLGQRQLGRRAASCGASTYGLAGSSTRRLDRAAEQRLGVVHQVGVQRVVAGDEHDQRARPGPPGPAGLLPERRQRAGEAGEHHGVQPGDVDAELQRVGGGHPEQVAAGERRLQRAALLRQVAAAVGGHPLASSGSTSASSRWALSAATSAPRRDRTKASVRAPSTTRSASRPAASAPADRRTGAPFSPVSSVSSGGSHSAKVRPALRRPVVGHRLDRAARSAVRRTPRVGHGRRGQHERRVGAVAARRPAAAGAAQGDVRAEHPAVGVALVDHDVAQPAQERRPARVPRQDARCSMSGLVNTQRAWRRTQSRSSSGVSPS